MPKLLLIPLLILLLSVSCGEAVPVDQPGGSASGAANNACEVTESVISDPARHRELLDCLNNIHSQNQEIIALLERIATELESRPLSR